MRGRPETPFEDAGSDLSAVASSVPSAQPHKGHRMPQHREICEPIPREAHLARSYLVRHTGDLLQELKEVKTREAARHRLQLRSAAPPLVERKSPLGAPPPSPPIRRLRRHSSASRLEGLRPEKPGLTPPAAEAARPRRPGLLLMELPQDPTLLANEHADRSKAIEHAIARQEDFLAECKREAEARQRLGVEASAPAFNWDHQPQVPVVSESQAQFYPRSIEKVRDCGGGKDSRFCRPYDRFYQHREAMCRQKRLSSRAV